MHIFFHTIRKRKIKNKEEKKKRKMSGYGLKLFFKIDFAMFLKNILQKVCFESLIYFSTFFIFDLFLFFSHFLFFVSRQYKKFVRKRKMVVPNDSEQNFQKYYYNVFDVSLANFKLFKNCKKKSINKVPKMF